jgi:hypothetical protein
MSNETAKKRQWRRVAMIIGLAATIIATAGFSANPAPAASKAPTQTKLSGDYVGRVHGSQMFIAVVVGDGKVLVYLCDGRRAFRPAKNAHWLKGRLAHGRAVLKSPDGVRLELHVNHRSATGRVTLEGGRGPLRFKAKPARSKLAGLYRFDGRLLHRHVSFGWIILNDGAFRGASAEAESAALCNRALDKIKKYEIKLETFGSLTPIEEDAYFGWVEVIVNHC